MHEDWFSSETRIAVPILEKARFAISKVLDLSPTEAGKIFTRFDAGRLLRDAEALDRMPAEERRHLPLAGATVCVKDLFDVRGDVTTAGSPALENAAPASRTALALARLLDAGALMFGRTNMSQFAYSGVGINPHYGTPENAISAGCIPGGSTSGGAVAVARGLCDGALGSDTGGSVRIPAALNGLAGFKPTQDTVPLDGAYPLSKAYDSIGVIAPRIATVALMHAVLAQAPRPAPVHNGVAGIRIGIIDALADGLDMHVAGDFEAALLVLRKAGATLGHVAIAGLEHAGRVNRLLISAEAHAFHKGHLDLLKEAADPLIVQRILAGGAHSPIDIAEATDTRKKACTAFAAVSEDYDILVAPTVMTIAPSISETIADFDRINAAMLRNTSAINFLDGCAATIPMNAPGAPATGLMIAAPHGGDWSVLAIAESVESLLSGR